ncbi:DUF4328 domain-containing protein [Corallococcus exercitus]|uniref:DUF4328 domain-containing protein n=1 Tax=Corallococcus exercitus TaxID=2316736 RepID=A0A7Y4KJ00_9BACT|nr:DUF4328 domain-containing protein [Corallococcus exercitus]NOK34170.1 DUF4328 domain-containing protein [Corallococcus exercitus]
MLNAAEGDVASQPMCPQHPEWEAVRTCARCGRYACLGCEGSEGRCRECTRLSALEVPDSRARARRATVLQYVSGGASLVGLLFNLLLYPELHGEQQEVAEYGALGLAFVVALTSQVCLLMWVHRVVRQLKALGADLGMTPARAVWMWLIPVLNWWKPYQVMRDIADRLGGMSFVAALPLQLWWGVNFVGRTLEKAEARMMAGKFGEVDSTTIEMVSLLSSVCSVAVALLCVQLIKEIQTRLDQRREGLFEPEAPVVREEAAAA